MKPTSEIKIRASASSPLEFIGANTQDACKQDTAPSHDGCCLIFQEMSAPKCAGFSDAAQRYQKIGDIKSHAQFHLGMRVNVYDHPTCAE